MLDQHRRGETRGLSSFGNGGGDVGGQVGETKNLAVAGAVQLFALGQIGKLSRSIVQQIFVEPVGVDDRLDRAGVRFRGRCEPVEVLQKRPRFPGLCDASGLGSAGRETDRS